MKILCPITASTDIDLLDPALYGTEFFCGYLPVWWIEKYNDSEAYRIMGNLSTPINNRNGAKSNILDITDLKSAIEKANNKGTRLYLALNAKYYPDYVYDDLKRYLKEVYSAGVRKMIICDLGLIGYVSQTYPNIQISISCLDQVTNSHAVGFFKQFPGVERIVFPRHMSSNEILNIAGQHPDLEFEYFIFSNKCLYDDGYCRGVHEFTPICKDLFFGEYYNREGKYMSDEEKSLLLSNEQVYRRWTVSESRVDLTGYCTASFGCTACSLVALKNVENIRSVKLSIRGHGAAERLRQVKMAKAVIDCVENGGDVDSVRKIVSSMYGKESLCRTGMSCIMV